MHLRWEVVFFEGDGGLSWLRNRMLDYCGAEFDNFLFSKRFGLRLCCRRSLPQS